MKIYFISNILYKTYISIDSIKDNLISEILTINKQKSEEIDFLYYFDWISSISSIIFKILLS